MIERATKHWETNGYGLWAIELLETGQLLGRSGLQYLPETDEVEVDFILDPSYWGLGLASEAGSASLRFAFDRLGLTDVIGLVHPENVASQRVLLKIGMIYDVRAEYFGMAVDRYVTGAV